MTDRPIAIPPAREITNDNAELLIMGSFEKPAVPFDDGKDDPRYEYESFQTIDGRVIRMPVRMAG